MAPDDPRHGERSGYAAGCREACCRDANTRSHKEYLLRKIRGEELAVDPTGTVRRLRALMALGWTAPAMDPYFPWTVSETQVLVLGRRAWVRAGKARIVADVYDQLSMTRPEGWVAERQRQTIARRHGWPPPLAWDDIDDPDETPCAGGQDELEVDPVVVERILAGDLVPANRAERAEVIRRWLDSGKSATALERLTGWNVARYVREAA